MKMCSYGEAAIYIDLEIDDAPDRRARTQAVARALGDRLPGSEIVLGAGSIAVVGVSGWDDLEGIVHSALGAEMETIGRRRLHEVRVAYDGPDLGEVAEAAGISTEDVVALHAAKIYEVELIGFLPGFAYLAGVDDRLVLGRRAAPRPRVAAGSVGIAGAYTAIYPHASPGGWNLIGRAVDVTPFDPERVPPALFAPGDQVRFVPHA